MIPPPSDGQDASCHPSSTKPFYLQSGTNVDKNEGQSKKCKKVTKPKVEQKTKKEKKGNVLPQKNIAGAKKKKREMF